MLIVRLLARGSALEHMMPVGECLRKRYAPASANAEDLELHLASSLFRVFRKASARLEYIEFRQDKAFDGLRERRPVARIVFLTTFDDNPFEQWRTCE